MNEMKKPGYAAFIGGPVLDDYFLLDHWPAQGDKIKGEYLGKVCGGMIGNAARNCSSLGIKTYCFDVVDTDSDGERIMEALRKDGVDTSYVIRRHNEQKLVSVVMVSEGERNVFLAGDRPSWALTLSPEQKEFFYQAEYVYSELLASWIISDDLTFYRDLKAHGVKLVFDLEVTMAAEDWFERVSCANLVFTNEFGVEKFREGESIEVFAERLFVQGVKRLVITLGEKGCRVITPVEDFALPTYQVKAADTTGAGDTFNSTFLSCVMKGMDNRTAAEYANAAASMAVTKPGPASGITTWEKIREFMQENKEKL